MHQRPRVTEFLESFLTQQTIALIFSPLDFVNGSNKAALTERIRHMSELFDRPCVIVENDRVKPGEEKLHKHKTL